MSWLELMFLPQSSGTSLIFKHFAYIKLEEWSRFGPGGARHILGPGFHAASISSDSWA